MSNEELALAIQRDGDQDGALRLRLLQMNEGFIMMTYKRYAPFIEFEDVESIAFIAIDRALQTYNPDKGTFLTALAWALNTEMQKAVSDNQLVKLPDARKADLRRLKTAIRVFNERRGRMPTEDELERLTGITADQQQELIKMGQALYPESLDAEIANDDGDSYTLGDTVPSDTDIAEESVNHCYLDQLASFIEACIKALPREHRLVLRLHFMNGESLNSIAERQNMPVNEVRKLKDKAIKVLRRNDRLRQYFEVENEFNRTSLQHFRYTAESQPEHHAIRLYERKDKKL